MDGSRTNEEPKRRDEQRNEQPFSFREGGMEEEKYSKHDARANERTNEGTKKASKSIFIPTYSRKDLASSTASRYVTDARARQGKGNVTAAGNQGNHWPAATPNREGAGVVQGREEPNPSIMRARGPGRGHRAEILASVCLVACSVPINRSDKRLPAD
jgi:hypothetical protein